MRMTRPTNIVSPLTERYPPRRSAHPDHDGVAVCRVLVHDSAECPPVRAQYDAHHPIRSGVRQLAAQEMRQPPIYCRPFGPPAWLVLRQETPHPGTGGAVPIAIHPVRRRHARGSPPAEPANPGRRCSLAPNVRSSPGTNILKHPIWDAHVCHPASPHRQCDLHHMSSVIATLLRHEHGVSRRIFDYTVLALRLRHAGLQVQVSIRELPS